MDGATVEISLKVSVETSKATKVSKILKSNALKPGETIK